MNVHADPRRHSRDSAQRHWQDELGDAWDDDPGLLRPRRELAPNAGGIDVDPENTVAELRLQPRKPRPEGLLLPTRGEEGDPLGDLAAEFLALSVPSRPFASAASLLDDRGGASPTDTLFCHRLLERSSQSAGEGLFGFPKLPGWLFERSTPAASTTSVGC